MASSESRMRTLLSTGKVCTRCCWVPRSRRDRRLPPPGSADFGLWCEMELGKPLDMLSREEQIRKFGDYVAFWNSRRLDPRLYDAYRAARDAPPPDPQHAQPVLTAAERLVLAEEDRDQRQRQTVQDRRRSRREADEYVEEMLGPRATGREAMLEKRRARREMQVRFPVPGAAHAKSA